MTHEPNNSTQRALAGRRRRGLLAGTLLVVLLFLSGCLALGLNVSRMLNVRAQLRATCQAAALAGAAELLDEGILTGYPDLGDDVLMAREAARLFGRMNPVNGTPVTLDPNKANDPTGDVVACRYDPLGPVNGLRTMPTAAEPMVNSLRVTSRLERNAYDRLTLWFAGLTGLTTVDVGCAAQATLDRRVAGFRPEPGVRVPVVPLAAEYTAWMRLATLRAVPGINDQFAVNYQTGSVVAGPDGVPEIVLACGPIPSEISAAATENPAQLLTGRCAAMQLSTDGSNPWIWSTRCRDGLGREDLLPWGGELVVRNQVLTVPVFAALPAELPWALIDQIGKNRAWPLGVPYAVSNAAPAYDLVGFAAGRIVAVRRATTTSAEAAWEIVVQPSTLVCSQAVAAATMSPNPWIGKLELTE